MKRDTIILRRDNTLQGSDIIKVAIYSRKSKFTGKGESVENQIQLCKEHAIKFLDIKEDNFIIYEDEGFSGGNINRPQFKKLLKDAKAKKFDILICYRLDRISRNVSDFSQLIKDLNKYNVNFISIREQFDTTTPMGRAMMYIASVFSQLERETIAERIRDNMMQLAKTGRWLGGNTPTGYKSEPVITIGDDGKERKMFKLVQMKEELDLVKIIFEKYTTLRSITKVEQYLVMNKMFTRNGLDFQRYAIKFILQNPVYAIADSSLYKFMNENNYELHSSEEEFNGVNGLIGYNRTNQTDDGTGPRYKDVSEWIISVGLHEGIISSEMWIEAQRLLNENKSKSYRKVKNTQSLLSGVLRCSSCGSYMRPRTAQRHNASGEQAFYYMCEMKEKSKKTRCEMKNINGNILDKSIVSELKKIAAKNSPIFNDVSTKKNLVDTTKNEIDSEVERIKFKIEEIDIGIDNLVSMIEKGQLEKVLEKISVRIQNMMKDKEEYQARLKELEDTEKLVKFNTVNLELVTQSLQNINDSAWDLMDVESKRRMIKSVVEKILWDGKKIDMMLFGSNCLDVPESIDIKGINDSFERETFPESDSSK